MIVPALLWLSLSRPAPAQDLGAELRRLSRPPTLRELAGSYAQARQERARRDLLPQPGHRVVADAPPSPAAQADETARRLYNGPRVQTDTVELSFVRPLPGLTAGAGWSERRQEWGRYQSPAERTKFAFIRFQLRRPRRGRPSAFLPQARVISVEDAGVEHRSVDDYSLRRLPRP